MEKTSFKQFDELSFGQNDKEDQDGLLDSSQEASGFHAFQKSGETLGNEEEDGNEVKGNGEYSQNYIDSLLFSQKPKPNEENENKMIFIKPKECKKREEIPTPEPNGQFERENKEESARNLEERSQKPPERRTKTNSALSLSQRIQNDNRIRQEKMAKFLNSKK